MNVGYSGADFGMPCQRWRQESTQNCVESSLGSSTMEDFISEMQAGTVPLDQ